MVRMTTSVRQGPLASLPYGLLRGEAVRDGVVAGQRCAKVEERRVGEQCRLGRTCSLSGERRRTEHFDLGFMFVA